MGQWDSCPRSGTPHGTECGTPFRNARESKSFQWDASWDSCGTYPIKVSHDAIGRGTTEIQDMTKQAKKADAQAVAKPYEPTPDERTAIEAYFARKKQKLPSPYMKVPKKGRLPRLLTNASCQSAAIIAG